MGDFIQFSNVTHRFFSAQSLCQGEINYARGGRATASSVYGNTTTAAAAFVGKFIPLAAVGTQV